MTQVQTAKDVIEQTKAFHHKLSSFYKNLAESVEKERVKLVLEYMSRHQENIACIMADYESEVSERVLNTWMMFAAKECDLSPFFDAELKEDMTAQEAIEVAIKVDGCILDTYKAMLGREVPDDVSSVFEDLLKLEEREKIKMAKAALNIETL
ncbi:hypothetical protein [Maridesulfovibrio bastinii]|jgi:rubrerythrin|uniref:hypothetical protein n=1 Tax=Maridesulfovibrio bastinii TaxID=47157 RepID=UPI00040F4A06|nr:hypothetical protein [Maridesulfovibrio bastinii]